MRYYTREGKAIDVTIGGLTDYQLQGLELSSNDISDNVFGRSHAYTLRVTIYTNDVSIYAGSLIGSEIVLSSSEVRLLQNRFVIVSNVGSMQANYAQESIVIEAVDYYVSGLQYQRCDLTGYNKLSAILSDLFPGLRVSWHSGGWSEPNRLQNFMFDVSVLKTDNGNTLPTKFDVLEAVLKYINRNLYISIDNGVPVVHLYSYADANNVTQLVINADTIASADRSVTMIDAASRYSVTSKYNDNENEHPTTEYLTKHDYGVTTISKQSVYYSNYYGSDGCVIDYPVSIPTVGDFTLAKIVSAVAASESGAVFVSSQSSEGDTYNANGREERLMMMGIVGDSDSHYTYTFEPNFFFLNKSYYTPDDLKVYLQIKHSRRFCEYPLPSQSDKKEYKPNKNYIAFRYLITMHFADDRGDYVMERYQNVGANNNAKSIAITTGSDVSPWSNGRIAQNFDNNGVLISLEQDSSCVGRQLVRVDIKVYPGLYVSDNGIDWQYQTFGCQYCYDTIEGNIVMSANVDSSVFSTDTVYAWRNDVESSLAINVNGRDEGEEVEFVTYAQKKGGNNVVLRYYNNDSGMVGDFTDYVGDEVDSREYYGGNCKSEERRVADFGSQYGLCRFQEEVTVKGLVGFGEVVRDNLFGKMCRVVSVRQDIIDNVTRIKALEYGTI